MAEYIERAAALNLLGKINPVDFGSMFDYEAHGAVQECLREISYGVEAVPAADVAEVRHGRWIPSDMGGGEPDEAYVCSECGEPWTLIDGNPAENNMRYCPACGARMDKEAAHEVPEP